MKTQIIAQNEVSRLERLLNGSHKLFSFGTIAHKMSNKKETFCFVSKEDIKDCTFNGCLDIQYLISTKRDLLWPK